MKLDRPIAIVGFMGCGKSAVARLLAANLNREMVDLDDLVTLKNRRTPAEIIQQDGEGAFRMIEMIVLKSLLREGFSGVVALGGGAWIERGNRALLEEHNAVTVWLDVPFDVCWSRIESTDEVRPLAPTLAQARSVFDRRRETYALARIHVRTLSDETVEDIASRVKAAVAKDLHMSD